MGFWMEYKGDPAVENNVYQIWIGKLPNRELPMHQQEKKKWLEDYEQELGA